MLWLSLTFNSMFSPTFYRETLRHQCSQNVSLELSMQAV